MSMFHCNVKDRLSNMTSNNLYTGILKANGIICTLNV